MALTGRRPPVWALALAFWLVPRSAFPGTAGPLALPRSSIVADFRLSTSTPAGPVPGGQLLEAAIRAVQDEALPAAYDGGRDLQALSAEPPSVPVGAAPARPAGKKKPRPGLAPTAEQRTELESHFPRLKGADFSILGPASDDYNCIAWSVRNEKDWLWPGDTVKDFDDFYKQHGYAPTTDQELAEIALYTDAQGVPTHAARREPGGGWSSKCGGLEKIGHDQLDWLNGGGEAYGAPARFYTPEVKPPGHGR